MVRQRKLMEKQLREKPSPKKQICYNKKSFTISEEKKKFLRLYDPSITYRKNISILHAP